MRDLVKGSILLLLVACFSLVVTGTSWMAGGSEQDEYSQGVAFSGVISSDTTWTLANSPYWIEGNVTVQEGKTLTIEAGVEVRVNGNYRLFVDGNLTVQGTSINRVIFTSNGTSPQMGDWNGLTVNATGTASIDYADFSYLTNSWLYSSNNSISNCNFNETELGFYVDGSNDNRFENNTFAPMYFGIWLYQSSRNFVANNTFLGSLYGIFTSGTGNSNWNTLTGNSFWNQSFSGIGIGSEFKEDYNQSIDSTNLVNGLQVLYILDPSDLTLRDLSLGHLTIVGGENITLENVDLPSGDGISFVFSNDVTLANCSAGGGFTAFHIYETSFLNMTNISSRNAERGISISASNYVNMTHVNSTLNEYGLDMAYSRNVTIYNSNASYNSKDGIVIAASSGFVLHNNSMWGNDRRNLEVRGQFADEYDREIDTTNQVNGRPVYYFHDTNGLRLENVDAGHIKIVRSSDVVLENVSVTNGDFLILESVSFCRVNNSAFIGNFQGVFSYSDNCTFENLTISGNTFHGISVIGNNTIKNNTISDNGIGISAFMTSFGRVYHNNFIANQNQTVFCFPDDGWDAGYPLGGNYWSDYQGEDMYHGPSQNILGSDGIGDTPYQVDQDVFDNYPLMRPVGSVVDSVLPGPVNDLTITQTTSDSITLQWTSPGDDMYAGQATAYDLRYSPQPLNDSNWDSANQVSGVPAPQPAGETEIFTVPSLQIETTYHFAIIASDEVPNWSPISNVVNGTTFDDILPTISNVVVDPAVVEIHEYINISADIEDNYALSNWIILNVTNVTDVIVETYFMSSSAPGHFYMNDTFSELGPFNFTIEARDERNNWQFHDGQFVVMDTMPPVADAGENVSVNLGESVIFLSESYDNHEIALYKWTFIEKDVEVYLYGEIVEYEFTEPGVYEVVLMVTDRSGNMDSDTIFVTVEGPDKDFLAQYWWVLVVIIVVVALVVLILFWRRARTGPTGFEEMESETEEGTSQKASTI